MTRTVITGVWDTVFMVLEVKLRYMLNLILLYIRFVE